MYRSLAWATSAGNAIATSRVALPEQACDAVSATAGYERIVQNLSQVSLERDNAFGDGWQDELGTVTGAVDTGLTVTLTVPVR